MHIEFATCERRRALEFLQKLYPLRAITDTDDCAKPVLDLVEKDVFRIPDPMMHGMRVAINPSKNWDESKREEVTAILQKFHDTVTKELQS